jgi:hypothetical protein
MTIDDIKLKGFAGLRSVETKPMMKSDHDGGVQEFRRVMSNGEYLAHICQFTNPMVGPFIIQAINEFCEATIKKEDELIANEKKQEEEGVINLMSNELWVEVAKFLRLQNYYQYEEGK